MLTARSSLGPPLRTVILSRRAVHALPKALEDDLSARRVTMASLFVPFGGPPLGRSQGPRRRLRRESPFGVPTPRSPVPAAAAIHEWQQAPSEGSFAGVTYVPVATAGPCRTNCQMVMPFMVLLFFMTLLVAVAQVKYL